MGGVFRKHEKMRNVDIIFARKCAMKKRLARRRDSWKQNVKFNLNEKITQFCQPSYPTFSHISALHQMHEITA
jgi:hypothetical protein